MAFDLALAVERLRPGAEYLPNEDRTAIVEWRDTRPEPTAAELQQASDAALAELAQREQADRQERDQLRAIYAALRDGTGTAAERIRRVELVCAWLLRRERLDG